MIKKILAVIFLMFLGFVIWASIGKQYQEIQTEIEIAAPPEKIWKILTNFNQWGTWNSTVTTASGNNAIGSTLSLTMRGPDGGSSNAYTPVIKELEAPRLLRWRANMIAEFIFTNEKIVILKASGSGTHVIHRETFKGPMVKVFWDFMQEGVPPILNQMNQDLKAIAEKN